MICPNLNDPVQAIQFKELTDVFPIEVAKKLWYLNGGYPLRFTRDGRESLLYKELLDLTGNERTAMLLKAQIYREKKSYAVEPTLNQLLEQIRPSNALSHSVRPFALTYKSVHKAMIEEALGNMITGERIKKGNSFNTVIFEFENIKTSYAVAQEKADKINKKYGKRIATLNTSSPDVITMYVNFSDEDIQNQLTREIELAKQQSTEKRNDEAVQRQIEGNWQVNEEGDVVPNDEYDFRDYMMMEEPIESSFSNTFDNMLVLKEQELDRLQKAWKAITAQSRIDTTNEELKRKAVDLRNRIRETKQEIYEFEHRGIFSTNIKKIAENDFKRIETLIQSKNPTSLLEAQRLLRFYLSVDSFEPTENMLFYSEEGDKSMSIELAPEQVVQTLRDIATQANKLNKAMYDNMKTVAYEILKETNTYTRLYGDEGISMEDMFKDIEDIDMFSEWLLSIDFHYSGDDAILAQIIKQLFDDTLLDKQSFVKRMIEEIDVQVENVDKRLIELGDYRRSRMRFGKKVATYNRFYQKSDVGNIRPYLLSEMSQTWYNFIGLITANDKKNRKEGLSFQQINSSRYKKIHENGRLLDITKIPEFKSNSDVNYIFSGIPWASDAEMDAYKQELINDFGEHIYNKFIDEQLNKILEFGEHYGYARNEQLEKEGVNEPALLSNVAKITLQREKYLMSPLIALLKADDSGLVGVMPGYEFGSQEELYTTLEFNTYIPLAKKDGGDIMINNDFIELSKDQVLYNFWKTLNKTTQFINESVPSPARQANSILSMNRGVLEAVLDKKVGQKREFLKYLGFKDNATIEAISNYFSTRNDDFDDIPADETVVNDKKFKDINSRVSKSMKLKLARLGQILETTVNNSTFVDLSDTSDEHHAELIRFFADTFNIDASTNAVIDYFNQYKKSGEPTQTLVYPVQFIKMDIEKKEMIKESLNLPKVLKYYAVEAAHYDAANEIIPMLKVLKDLYQGIQKSPKNKNKKKGKAVQKTVTGAVQFRQRGSKRMQDYYDRVIRGYQHEIPQKTDKNYKKIYTAEEKKLIEELNILIDNARSDKERNSYIAQKAALGGRFSFIAVWSVMLDFMRFQGLSWNLNSSLFNYIYGYMSSYFMDQLGEHWTSGNFQASFNFVLGKGRKNLNKVGGKLVKNWNEHAKEIEKCELFINKSLIINDMRNEKQKASNNLGKKDFAGGAKKMLSPFYISVTAIEWRNQTANVLSVLMDMEVEGIDVNGNKFKSKIFDGNKFLIYDNVDGKLVLKPEFRTPENILNWEDMKGKQYKHFYRVSANAIRIAQGDYSPTGGMMAKNGMLGKTMMMFNTWLPMMAWQRYGKGKNLTTGTEREQATYTKHNPHTLAILLSVSTLFTFFSGSAIIGAAGLWAVGAGGAAVLTSLFVRKFSNKLRDVHPEMTFAKELVGTYKCILLKTLGLPLNLAIRALPANMRNSKEFLKPDVEKTLKMSAKDAKAMQFILAELAVVLNLMMMKLAVTAALSCNEDNPACQRRMKVKNFLDNSFTRIMSDIALMLNPIKVYKNLTDGSALSFITKVGAFIEATYKYSIGEDLIISGEYTGESRIGRATDKLFMPNVYSINHIAPLFHPSEAIQDIKNIDSVKEFGGETFDYLMPRKEDYSPNDPIDWQFTPAIEKAERNIKQKRAELKQQYIDEGYSEKIAKRKVNEKIPTLARKKELLELEFKNNPDLIKEKMNKYIDEWK